jgi:hypothetical protein
MALSRERTKQEIDEEAQRAKHKATLEALANLPAQHKGAPTAKQHVQKLREAITAGAPAADVHAVARALFAREPKFWRKWAVEEKRTPEERAFLSESGMIGADAPR